MAEYGGNPFFSCRNCKNPLALREDLLSKKFVAKSGAAYMFSHAMNVIVGQKEDRKMITGVFSVADIYCSNCGQELGWKYIRAYDPGQMFKEGRLLIERAKIVKMY
ncbi:protein yippee-like At4g27740 [Argentina anserina]|uniref:protein yippee-like At4g27740 n=1 Tax=Argentina anserina TaxID=57926 RepID=UPI002176909C|nr:protein yippee-like At4g27740 [Potentilla anserina]XP_050386782.1 protein yippee-like At4g27740 [Potentilla anserina]